MNAEISDCDFQRHLSRKQAISDQIPLEAESKQLISPVISRVTHRKRAFSLLTLTPVNTKIVLAYRSPNGNSRTIQLNRFEETINGRANCPIEKRKPQTIKTTKSIESRLKSLKNSLSQFRITKEPIIFYFHLCTSRKFSRCRKYLAIPKYTVRS